MLGRPPTPAVLTMLNIMRLTIKLALATALLLLPGSFFATPLPQTAPDIGVNARFDSDKVRKGGRAQGAVVMDIPSGYHVNSNRPLEKFLIASQLRPPSV